MAANMMTELSHPIQVIKYSEQTNNRDTFFIQAAARPQNSEEPKPVDKVLSQQNTDDKIIVHNKNLLFDDEGPPSVVRIPSNPPQVVPK